MAGKELYPYLVNNCFYTPKTYTEHFDFHAHGEPANVVINRHGYTKLSHCHSHDYFEINYLYSGQCKNMIAGDVIEMNQGSAVIMAPGTVHSVSESNDFLMFNILIRPSYFFSVFSTTESRSYFASFVSSQNTPSPYSYVSYAGTGLNDLIDSMLFEKEKRQEDKLIMLDALTTQLIVKMNRNADEITISETVTTTFTVVSEILEYIYSNYKTVSLSSLAKEFDYSKEHLSRLIYKGTGIHFTDIVLGVKLSHVLDHMSNENLSINRISEICGFESVENFHRIFKKKFGISPKKFREINFK